MKNATARTRNEKSTGELKEDAAGSRMANGHRAIDLRDLPNENEGQGSVASSKDEVCFCNLHRTPDTV